MDLFNRKKVESLEQEIISLKGDILKYKNNCETYKEIFKNTNCSTLLIEENKKLIIWIEKILSEFGTVNVYERKTIHIPVIKRSDMLEKMIPSTGIKRMK